MNILPNFLIAGASKSGTSSLYHYLRQHPDIFLSNIQKEGRYFSQMPGNYQGPGDKNIDASLNKDLNSYQKLFNDYKNEKAIGDISPDYLYFYEKAIPLIKKTLGENTKIILILRSPVDRAFSSYMHFKRDRREMFTFEESLEKEEERKTKNWIWAWQYKNSGLYYSQVKAYLDNFENTQVIIFEDFKTDPQLVLTQICNFLEVSSDFIFDTSHKYNVSGDPKNKMLYQLESSKNLIRFIKKIVPQKVISKVKKNWTGEKQMVKSEMNPETREKLIEFFREDVVKLQDLIHKDLSHWLQ